jgi:phosphonate transport system permease protein
MPGSRPGVALASRTPRRLGSHLAYVACAGFLIYAYHHLKLPLERIPRGLVSVVTFLTTELLPPDLGYAASRLPYPVLESVAMAIGGTFVGLGVTMVLAWWAAQNLTPSPWILYPVARLMFVVSRSLHELVWALLFVSILGFGPLPGTAVLAIVYMGSAGKLFSEALEVVDARPLEAIRAAGGTGLQVLLFGALPQVRAVWAGIAIYCWDVVLRASTVLGIVGAGGLGADLRGSIESLRYQRVGAILMIIVLLVAVSEGLSAEVRRRLS